MIVCWSIIGVAFVLAVGLTVYAFRRGAPR